MVDEVDTLEAALVAAVWTHWVGLGMYKVGRGKCANCGKRRILYQLVLLQAAFPLTTALCLTDWGMRA